MCACTPDIRTVWCKICKPVPHQYTPTVQIPEETRHKVIESMKEDISSLKNTIRILVDEMIDLQQMLKLIVKNR